MKRFSSIALLSVPAVLVLHACTPQTTPGTQTGSPSSNAAQSAASVGPESLNRVSQVSLHGVIQAETGGQNSYVLVTPGGSTFTLVSGATDFSTYNGKDVEVSGSLEESMDGNVRLLTVQQIAEVVVDGGVSSSEEMSSETMESSSVAVSSDSGFHKASSSSKSSSSSSKKSSSSSSSVEATLPEDMQLKVNKMAKVRPPESWTQQYCSSHIGVCFPVRSDYWYHSFGANADTLWHIELSSEDVVNLGDGPMSVDLVSGKLEGGLNDGLVQTEGSMIVGYRTWTNGRYFRVSAPAALKVAVEMITKGIAPYDTPNP